MRLKKYVKIGMCLALTTTLLLTSCSQNIQQANVGQSTKPLVNQTENPVATGSQTASPISAEDDSLLFASLREKYGATTVDYADSLIYLERDEEIEIALGFNPYENSDSEWSDYFVIYQDSNLQYPVQNCLFDFDATTKQLHIKPPVLGYVEMMAPYGSDIDISDLSGSYLYDDITEDNWGNFEQLYLVQKCDLTTGEPIEKPLINIIKIQSELNEAPVVKYSSNEKGEALISWNPVEGAKEYLLFTVTKMDTGYDSYAKVFGRTSETSWTAPSLGSDDGRAFIMNDMFRNFITSDDDLLGGMDDMNGDFYDVMQEYVGVIAITNQGASPISDLYSVKQYSQLLPNEWADHVNAADTDDTYRESIDNLPAEAAITMCDGSISPRVIDYDFDNAVLEGEGEYTRLLINGYASGTQLYNEYMVAIDNPETVETDLQKLKERQEALKNKAGSIDQGVDIIDEDPSTEPSQSVEPTQSVPETNSDINITANSALSEYIATKMLTSATVIDISMFTESQNKSIVVDAVMEAKYQNPLVMGIKEMGYDEGNRILYITYDGSVEETQAKRQEVLAKAKEVVGQIITTGMSDLEKEFAINEYLCNLAQYDNAALENAEANDFKQVDDEYEDSFTPYGVIVKGLGVCASYAGAFKVLADEAGLDSIVVTGYLNGNLPHAWNRVNIEGEWLTVDVTNNDNDVIQNALLNVSDQGISGVLTEDDEFVISDKVSTYTCSSDKDEYYHYQSKYFEKEQITEKLIQELQENGQTVLRTDYTINDEDFYAIAQAVAQSLQMNIQGYYWLGVINLSK